MPSTTKSRVKGAPTPQTDQQPTPAAAAQTPTDTSLFDDTPPEGQPTIDPAAPSNPSAADRPEGIDGAQEDSLPADPAPGAPTDNAEGDAADPAAESEAEPEAVEQSSVEPAEVRLGQVTGLLHRLPLGDVLATADAFAEKIEALTYTAAVQALLPRMRASEGRCAPVYFTMDDDMEPEFLFAGDDALSAAKAIGLETVFVVLLYPEDAGAAQAYLARQASTATVSTEDDELVWRAHIVRQPASPA